MEDCWNEYVSYQVSPREPEGNFSASTKARGLKQQQQQL